ncbi:tryptophan synthase beta chain 1 [Tanacetum coccineum]|uniref:Tryptophan synthase beta chain 1 n=1 Tax=Tanacetum coccineum TaxID=301880 RepID=A0ABQ5DKS6_9ASTR
MATSFSSSSSLLTKPYISQLPIKLTKLTNLRPNPSPISCVMTNPSTNLTAVPGSDETVITLRPDILGRFGKFGGKYVPETLMYALTELEDAFRALASDNDFQYFEQE